jgi:uncharacterized protein YegP (UPF0339 family)
MAEHPQITKVELYVGGDGDWWFTAYSSNGRAIVRSTEGYENKEDAIGAIHGVHGDDILIEEGMSVAGQQEDLGIDDI